MLPYATQLEIVDTAFRSILTPQVIRSVISLIPDVWLSDDSAEETPEQRRQVYQNFLETRLANSELFVKEANHARETII